MIQGLGADCRVGPVLGGLRGVFQVRCELVVPAFGVRVGRVAGREVQVGGEVCFEGAELEDEEVDVPVGVHFFGQGFGVAFESEFAVHSQNEGWLVKVF